MNVHRALNNGGGRFRIHHVEDGVDDLVAARAEDHGAQNLARPGIDKYFHEAFRLALFDGAFDFGHGAFANQRRSAALANFRFRQATTTEGRIDVERVGGNAIGDAARVVVEQVGGDDFGVVEAVWVNAPRPLQSPIAQMPGTLVGR